MNTELQLITNDAPELVRAVSTAALEPTTGERLIMGFAPFFRDAKAILDKSRTITVTDATQVTEIKASRENRLKLRAVRIAADKTRKELKEDSIKLGNAIQSVYNLLVLDIEKEEKRLQEAEDFAARAEAARKEKLKAERIAELFAIDPMADLSCYELGSMLDATFANLVESTRMVVNARIEAAKKVEAERIERERIAAKEAARKEAERQAQIAEAQRIAAEEAQKARIEREAREKVEAEARIAAEAAAKEAARLAAEVAAREAAAAAERKRIEDEAAARLAAERAEAERLRKEAEAKAAREASRIRAEAEAREAEERKAREAAEAEAKRLREEEQARRIAEERAKTEAVESARRAAQAPDKEKLLAFAASIESLTVPEVTTEAARKVRDEVAAKCRNFANWIRTQSAPL